MSTAHGVRRLLVASLVTLALASVAPVVGAADREIAIRDAGFDPAEITVFAGEPVTWTNASTSDHTVTNTAAGLDSGAIGPGEAYGHVFDAPGVFRYTDTIGGFTGSVIVEVAPSTAPVAGSPTPSPPPGTLPPNFSPVPAPSLEPTAATSMPASPAPGASPVATPANASSAAPTWLIALVVAALLAALGWWLLRARSRSTRPPGG